MSVVIPEGFALFSMRWVSANFYTGGAATTIGWGAIGDPNVDAPVFAGAIIDAWDEVLKSRTDSQTSLASVYWAGPTQSGEVAANIAGTRSGTAISPNTAFLQTLVTSAKGPRGRGRLYWPSVLGQADVGEDGLITGANLTTLTSLFGQFWSALDEWEPAGRQVVLQRETDVQKTPPLSPPPIVTGRVAQQRAATQRRRLRR